MKAKLPFFTLASILIGISLVLPWTCATASVIIIQNQSEISAAASATDTIDSVTDNDANSTGYGSHTAIPDSFGGSVSANAQVSHTNPTGSASTDASANLSSTISQAGPTVSFIGSGAAQSDTTGVFDTNTFSGSASASSKLSLTFQLDTAYSYTLSSGQINTINTVSGATYVDASLWDITNNSSVFFDEIGFGESGTFSFSGVLPAGTYRYGVSGVTFVQSLDVGAVDFDSVNFSMSMMAVPLPGAFLLLISGLSGLAMVMRRN